MQQLKKITRCELFRIYTINLKFLKLNKSDKENNATNNDFAVFSISEYLSEFNRDHLRAFAVFCRAVWHV